MPRLTSFARRWISAARPSPAEGLRNRKGNAMKLYFLALGTLLFVCVGCAHDGHEVLGQSPHLKSHHHKKDYYAPPAAMMAGPGPMVAGPGPGVMQMSGIMGGSNQPYSGYGVTATSQVRFLGPEGSSVGWQIAGGYAENQVVTPGRYNFQQGATYRLKLSNIPGREGLVLYPTLQVYPSHPTTDAYLSHNSLPLRLTDEDLDQVETNNFVTKVIYLPDPRFQELAIAGVEELVSTRLDPGLDPVAEADRRGAIMAVLRVGNMDLEMGEGHMIGAGPQLQQVSHTQVDGMDGQHVPPMPISTIGTQPGGGVPHDVLTAGPAGPGVPVNGMVWGYPRTGTPIGLQGPPHIPYGRPAGLKSHTVRNLSDTYLPDPVDHLLIDVRHEPGISVPAPAKHIEYTEQHPTYGAGEVSWPAGKGPMPGGGFGGGVYCPDGNCP